MHLPRLGWNHWQFVGVDPSGSICIACHDLGYDLTWMELDKDYYDAAVARYKLHASQAQMFEPNNTPVIKDQDFTF